MTADPREKFCKLIDLTQSRVELAPHITFICGGPVDPRLTTNHSVRNMFMNLSGRLPDETEGFTLAENFKDWKDGYKSLSDFENDIAALSSIVVIILESPGSLAELGLFYANKELRKKMVLIVHRAHYDAESFIKFGFINPMEAKNNEAIKVYEIDNENIENISESEVNDVLSDVVEYSSKIDKSSAFRSENRGHIIFALFQLIDLFTILTFDEIKGFSQKIGINQNPNEIRTALYILQKFKLIVAEKKSSQLFYYTPTKKPDRVKFHYTIYNDGETNRRYDTLAIKAEVIQFYNQVQIQNPSMRRRLNIIERITNAG